MTQAERQIENTAKMLHGIYIDVCQYYVQNFHRNIPPAAARQLAECVKDGMQADVIREAMDVTQLAPRPSWAYCSAILRRCDREGIKDMAAWNEERERHRAAANPALRYEQREYQPEDFGPEFFIDLDKYAEERNGRIPEPAMEK